MPRHAALALAPALLLFAATARAQLVAPATTYPDHLDSNGSPRPLRDPSLQPQWASFDDCQADEVLRFNLNLQEWTGVDVFEIWAGTTDCTQTSARGQGATYQCWQVSASSGPTPVVTSETIQVPIRLRDVVGYLNAPPQDGAYHAETDPSACRTQPTDAPVTIGITFMAVNSSNGYAVDGVSFTYSLTVDLVGPPAPTLDSVVPGDGLLVANWTPAPGPQGLGVDLFFDDTSPCQNGPLTSPPLPALDGISSGGICTIPLQYLDLSAPPTPTSAALPGLDNGVRFGVALSAIDEVDNAGPQSAELCATPQAGDDAGVVPPPSGDDGGLGASAPGNDRVTAGCLCALDGPRARGSAPLGLALALGIVCAARRSRRRRFLSHTPLDGKRPDGPGGVVAPANCAMSPPPLAAAVRPSGVVPR